MKPLLVARKDEEPKRAIAKDGWTHARLTMANAAAVSSAVKGLRYPPEPPTVEEIIAVMSAAGDGPDGLRQRALIVVLWRAGPRISEAPALVETDLDQSRSAILVRQGKGGKRR